MIKAATAHPSTKMTGRVAIVYDWVTTPHGGAEQVLQALHQLYPQAPLFTLIHQPRRATWSQEFQVHPSWLQRLPGAQQNHRWWLPLMPLAVESLDLSAYDVVISVSSAMCKGVLTKPNQLHVCYLLTPPRYLYTHTDEYQVGKLFPGLGWLQRQLLDYLRWWDQAAAWRPDVVIPISQLVAERCQQWYQRPTAAVITPPVSLPSTVATRPAQLVKQWGPSIPPFYLCLSRLVSYKRLDLAIRVTREQGIPLVIAGDGPARAELAAVADGSCIFLNTVSAAEKAWLLQQTRGLLMPGVEDFGITALEALSYGKPVLVHRQSGVAELLTDGQDSVFLAAENYSAMNEAFVRLQQLAVKPELLLHKAQKYATTEFCRQFDAALSDIWRRWRKKGSL